MHREKLLESQTLIIITFLSLISACASKNICEDARTEQEEISIRCQEDTEGTTGTEEETEGPLKGELDCPDVAVPYYECTLKCHKQVRVDGKFTCDPVLDPDSENAMAYKDCLKNCDLE